MKCFGAFSPRPSETACSYCAWRDVALAEHRQQHLVAALLGRAGMEARVVQGRRLRQAGDQRRLADVELRAVLVEIGLRRRLAAVGDAAVGDDVQIRAEDLVLGPVLRHLDGEPRLLDLALERLRVGQVDVADELLLDRRGPLDDVAGLEVVEEGAGDALVVDSAVLVEALVLDVDRGDLEPLGDLVELHRGAVLERRDLGEQPAVAVVDLGRHARIVGLHRLQVDALENVRNGHRRAHAARHEHRCDPDRDDDEGGRGQRPAAAAALLGAALAPPRADVAEDVVVRVARRLDGAVHGVATPVTSSPTMPSSCRRVMQRSRSAEAATAAWAASGIHTPTV